MPAISKVECNCVIRKDFLETSQSRQWKLQKVSLSSGNYKSNLGSRM